MKPITVHTPGIGRERNPYQKYVPGQPEKHEYIYEVWKEWELAHPELDALDQHGNKLPPGEYEGEVVWQWEYLPNIWKNVTAERAQKYRAFPARQIFQVTIPDKVNGEEIKINLNDFSLSIEDIERAFCFGYISNPENNCLDNVEMMRRWNVFKEDYLKPTFVKKGIID